MASAQKLPRPETAGRGGSICPAGCFCFSRAQPPDQGEQHRNTHSGGNKVLHCKACHLGQIAHGAFARIGLPVGIGDKTHRRVQSQIPACTYDALRIQGQAPLRHEQQHKCRNAHGTESKHAAKVTLPAHLFRRVDAQDAVQAALAWGQHLLQPERFAVLTLPMYMPAACQQGEQCDV